MDTDWKKYQAMCGDGAKRAFERFGALLMKGSRVATAQSAPAYTGPLMAVLVTVCSMMTDNLKLCFGSGDSGRDLSMDAEIRQVRDTVRKKYFERLSAVPGMDIAEEYFRVRVRHLQPDTGRMTRWLLSFNGRDEEAKDLAARAEKETEAFAREDMPGIWTNDL